MTPAEQLIERVYAEERERAEAGELDPRLTPAVFATRVAAQRCGVSEEKVREVLRQREPVSTFPGDPPAVIPGQLDLET